MQVPSIQPATADDVVAVGQLALEACRGLWPGHAVRVAAAHAEAVRRSLKRRHEWVWVVRDGSGCIGACMTRRFGAGGAEVYFLLVRDGHRRRGLGRLLLNAALRRLQCAGGVRVFVPDDCSDLRKCVLRKGFRSLLTSHARLDVTGELYFITSRCREARNATEPEGPA
ncbi:MAG: GNAT family N-acetyltransferase [Pseudomonadota bacterium]